MDREIGAETERRAANVTVINLPLDESKVELSDEDESVFWKQIIPMNRTIKYGNQEITFNRSLLERLKANYDSHLMDQTAFQLVDDENRHDTPEDLAKDRNWDPERYRGDVQETKIVDSGFWGKFKLTPEGVKTIKNNPKLGVSASIKPEWTDEKGQKHEWVLRHVVGTLNPKIKGMSPWQKESITLTAKDDENEEVFDLTTVEPSTKPDDTTDDSKISVDKAEYEKMVANSKFLEDGEKILDEILAEEDEEVKLSDSEPEYVKDPAITALENKVAASDWRAERERLTNKGVPAGMLNLCDGIMSVAEVPTINLSDGASADPRETILKLLEEAKGYVDLTDENGHGKTPDERQAAQDAAERFADGFINEYNLGLF